MCYNYVAQYAEVAGKFTVSFLVKGFVVIYPIMTMTDSLTIKSTCH